MRITLARAGPVAVAFDCHLATIGFPFEQARRRGAKESDAGLRTPNDVATFVAEGTSIGEGGAYLVQLAREGRFTFHPFPGPAGFDPVLGRPILTTPSPGENCVSPLDVARSLTAGEDLLVVFGLGPRGLPTQLLDGQHAHLELTGKNISMETATALGALPAMIAAHLSHLTSAGRA